MKRMTRLAGAIVIAGALMIAPRADAATAYVHPETMAVFNAKLHAINAQCVKAFTRVRAAEALQGRLQQDFVAETRGNLLAAIHSTHVGATNSVYARTGAPGTKTSIAYEYQIFEQYLQMLARSGSGPHPQPESTMASLKLSGFWLQKATVLFRTSQSVNAMFSHSVSQTSLLMNHDLSLLGASARDHVASRMGADQQQALLEDRARLAMEQEWGLELQQMNVQLQNLLKLRPTTVTFKAR